jgi:hypothetical protein
MAGRDKEVALSISIRAVDKATTQIKRINDRLDKVFEPFSKLRKEMGTLHERLGLDKMAAGFKGIGGMVTRLATQVGVVAGVAAGAAFGFKKLVDAGDTLGDTAERVGFTVDALAQLRFAAERSGSSAEELDAGLTTFNKTLGQARAGTGRFAAFLKKVSPALLRQVKGAKSNEEAFDLMARAMSQIEDPAKRAALAAAAFGGSGVALAPLLGKGAAGIEELRQRYFRLAGPQQKAVEQASKLKDSFQDLGSATDSVKAALLSGLGPAFLEMSERATAFLTANRARLTAWIQDFGEKLPGRIAKLVDVFRSVVEILGSVVRAIGVVVDKVGGAETAVKLLVGAFVALKAVELIGHLGGIARGFLGIAAAARAAAAGTSAATAAASASGAGTAAAAGGAARSGLLGGVARAAPWLAALWGAAAGSAAAIDGDQDLRQTAQQRGAFLNDDLKRFRSRRGDALSRRALNQTLRDNGFVDPKTGRFADTAANRNALAGGDLFDGFAGVPDPRRMAQITETIAELNKVLAAAQPQKAQVTVDFKNAPRGTRVNADPANTANVDVSVGYQTGAIP